MNQAADFPTCMTSLLFLYCWHEVIFKNGLEKLLSHFKKKELGQALRKRAMSESPTVCTASSEALIQST